MGTLIKVINFESDVEEHVNTGDLSDLSDVFDDDWDSHVTATAKVMNISNIGFSRDIYMVNVPTEHERKTRKPVNDIGSRTLLLAKPDGRRDKNLLEDEEDEEGDDMEDSSERLRGRRGMRHKKEKDIKKVESNNNKREGQDTAKSRNKGKAKTGDSSFQPKVLNRRDTQGKEPKKTPSQKTDSVNSTYQNRRSSETSLQYPMFSHEVDQTPMGYAAPMMPSTTLRMSPFRLAVAAKLAADAAQSAPSYVDPNAHLNPNATVFVPSFMR